MNATGVTIVPYQPAHLERMVEITLEGFRGVSIDYLLEQRFGPVTPGWEQRKAADVRRLAAIEPQGCFVAVNGALVVGYVTVETSQEKLIGRIADLAVDARCRRHGLGSRLIDQAIAYIKASGMRFAKIETLTTNESGQVVYPRMGFTEVARQIHYVMPLDNAASESAGANRGDI